MVFLIIILFFIGDGFGGNYYYFYIHGHILSNIGFNCMLQK